MHYYLTKGAAVEVFTQEGRDGNLWSVHVSAAPSVTAGWEDE